MKKSIPVLVLTLLIVVGAENTETQRSPLECGNNERLISLNSSLTPPDEIVASGSVSGNLNINYRMVLNFGSGTRVHTWCTNAQSVFDAYKNITIHFSDPVLITAILSSGTTDERESGNGDSTTVFHFVTNFTLDYVTIDNVMVTYSTDFENPKYFAAPSLNTYIKIEEPFVAQSIRLKALDWIDTESLDQSNGIVCHGVAVFGCLNSEAVSSTKQCPTQAPSTFTTPEYTTNAASTYDTTCVCQNATSTSDPGITQQVQSLAVLVPVLSTLVVIAIITVLVLIGIVVVYYVVKKREIPGPVTLTRRDRMLLTHPSTCSEGDGDINTLRMKKDYDHSAYDHEYIDHEESTQGSAENDIKANPMNNTPESSGSN